MWPKLISEFVVNSHKVSSMFTELDLNVNIIILHLNVDIY